MLSPANLGVEAAAGGTGATDPHAPGTPVREGAGSTSIAKTMAKTLNFPNIRN